MKSKVLYISKKQSLEIANDNIVFFKRNKLIKVYLVVIISFFDEILIQYTQLKNV